MADIEMNVEEHPVIAPTGLPETIKYNESVRAKLNKRHDKEFIRREESKLHELISSLPEEEIARLDEELILVSRVEASPAQNNPSADQ